MPIVAQHFDSNLGRWTHTGWRPGPGDPLEWAVDRVWDFDGMAAHPQERVFPNGHLELIVQLDDRYHDVTTAGAVPTPAACVTGIFSRSAVVQAPRRPCRVLGVRLRPAGAWALLEHPLFQLAGLTADLGDLLGRAGDELAERCHDAGSGIERVRRAVAWLGRQLRRPDARGVDPAVHWVARRIADTGGSRPIAVLRAETGLTDAQRAGYFDQPHMNAEFREMAGLTPRAFLAATRYPNSLSLPEPA